MTRVLVQCTVCGCKVWCRGMWLDATHVEVSDSHDLPEEACTHIREGDYEILDTDMD